MSPRDMFRVVRKRTGRSDESLSFHEEPTNPSYRSRGLE